MSSNTATTVETSSNIGLIIGLTVGGVILLMLIAFFVIRAKKGSSAALPTNVAPQGTNIGIPGGTPGGNGGVNSRGNGGGNRL